MHFGQVYRISEARSHSSGETSELPVPEMIASTSGRSCSQRTLLGVLESSCTYRDQELQEQTYKQHE